MKCLVLSFVLYFYGLTAWSIPTLSQNVMISGPSKLALESALRVGKKGGNPIDMAVAYGLTLSVTHPYFGSLGGGGFALINTKSTKTPVVLDFRERAPLKTESNYYVGSNKNSRLGGAAVGVPGFPMGLWDMHQKYGKLSWGSLFSEALKYSKDGFSVSSEWYKVTKRKKEKFWSGGAHHLIGKNLKVPYPGDVLKQKGLYQALKLFKDKGPKGFYQGAVAKDLVDSIRESGGDMSLKDLNIYKTVWRSPLETTYNTHKLYLMPPPSSGGAVLKTALKLSELLDLKSKKFLSVEELHTLSEIMAMSFRGRALLGDPDFIKNPLDHLSSKSYLATLKKSFKKNKVSKLKPLNEEKYFESTETTHFIVMNSEGEAVSLTVTLNGNYGSGVVTKKFGIALNNEMDDFATQPGKPNMFGLIQGKANQVKPMKRPLSSMSPTLVVKDGKAVLAIGAPGGPRIINGVFQGLYRSLESGLNMEQAIYAPRLHHQFLPRVTFYEKNQFSPEVLKGLEKKGHTLKPIRNVAIVYGVKVNKEGLLEGAADFRGEGFVGGF